MKEPITILVVDDDQDDREMFIECVKSISPDIKCVEAKDGAVGLERLHSRDERLPDFIFLDFNMPKINGAQFLEAIRSDPKYADIPVVLYTTSEMNDTLRNLKADYFVTKPIRQEEICKTINEILEKFGR